MLGGGGRRSQMSKADRKLKHENYIFDIVADVSQSEYWRSLLFSGGYNELHLISANTMGDIPDYNKKALADDNLQFYVSKVLECPEEFDEGAVIFKFEPVEFPEIERYSGNYFGDGYNLAKGIWNGYPCESE